MGHRARLFVSLLVGAFCIDAAARAQEPEPEPESDVVARTSVRAPVAARNPLDATAAGTTIDLDHRPASGETMRDVLVEAPGARVVSTGSIGQFNTVTLRGAELGQTAVMIDDLPIGGPEIGAVDLSLLPVSAFESIEVYRGGAPAWLGDGSIGGVVRLVPRTARGSRLRAVADGASFGTARGTVDFGVADGPLALSGSFGAFTSRQDFRYVDDGGTRYDPTDDRVRRQENAEVDQRHVFVRARVDAGRSRIELLHLGVGRSGGFPGAGLRRTAFAEQSVSQNIGLLAWTHETTGSHRTRVQARFGVVALRQGFSDPYGGVGLLPLESDDRTHALSGRLATTVEVHRSLDLTAIATMRADRVDRTDVASSYDEPVATRLSPGATVELRHHLDGRRARYEARASYRFERPTMQASFLGDYGVIDRYAHGEALHTGRFGIVYSPIADLSLSASAYRGARAPSVLELFGNRSTVSENPGLRAESGLGGELGLVARGTGGSFCIVGELRGFAQTLDDVIVFVPTSQFQARARNLARATVMGLEASVRLSVGTHLDVMASWNATRSRDADGYALPFRSPNLAYGRVLGALGRRGRHLEDLRAYVDVAYTSPTFVAPKELQRSPSRVLVGVGVELVLFRDWLALSASVRDALDVRGFDFLGYPLSGRSFTGSLSVRREFQ